MLPCYKVNLGDAMLAQQLLAELKQALTGIYVSANKPQTMWACYRHESVGIHCHLMVYLSAELQAKAGLNNVLVCNSPLLADACFLLGE
jgi:hypothetical protein